MAPMRNNNVSDLDISQLEKRVIDSAEDAYRVVLVSGVELAIELDANDGDSVATKSLMQTMSSPMSSNTVAGEFIPEFNVEGYSEFQLMAKMNSAVSGSCLVTLQISPVASGDVWLNTAATLDITGSADIIGSVINPLAKRARVLAGANSISEGSASIYLMVRG